MGIYYYAVDENQKTFFSPPGDYNNKSPGIYHPDNPFPSMVIMKNIQGYRFEIYDDCGAFYETFCTWKDITEEVYAELIRRWPEWTNKDMLRNLNTSA